MKRTTKRIITISSVLVVILALLCTGVSLYINSIAFYERWTAKAAANPAWAKENPIHFQVTKNGAEELELQLAPKLDPETH